MQAVSDDSFAARHRGADFLLPTLWGDTGTGRPYYSPSTSNLARAIESKRRRSAPIREMSNIAKILKEEITRIARRESRASLERTRKVLSQQRQEIAALKARLKLVERSTFVAERDQPRTAVEPPAEESTKQVRFMPKGIVSMRQRLGLSVADLAKLLSVSDQTIYNWERGVSKPRPEHRAKLVSLRRVGKRELQSYLAQSASG